MIREKYFELFFLTTTANKEKNIPKIFYVIVEKPLYRTFAHVLSFSNYKLECCYYSQNQSTMWEILVYSGQLLYLINISLISHC